MSASATHHNEQLRHAFQLGAMSTLVIAEEYDLDTRCMSMLARSGLFSDVEKNELINAIRRVLAKRLELVV